MVARCLHMTQKTTPEGVVFIYLFGFNRIYKLSVNLLCNYNCHTENCNCCKYYCKYCCITVLRRLNGCIGSVVLNGSLSNFAVCNCIDCICCVKNRSIISNNLNSIMKKLTVITIILMIPTCVSGFFGMNVPNRLENWLWAFPLIVLGTILISFIGYWIFKKQKLF